MNRFFLLLTTVALLFISCEGSDWNDILGGDDNNGEVSIEYNITLGLTLLNFDAEGGEKSVNVETNIDYELLCESDWVSYKRVEAGVVVTVEANPSEEPRKSMLVIYNKEFEIYENVVIEQSGYIPVYEESSATVDRDELAWDELIVKGTTSGNPQLTFSLKVIEGGGFCVASPIAGKVGDDFLLEFAKNMSGTERSVRVNIKFSDGYSKSFVVRQGAAIIDSQYNRAWAEQPERLENRHYLHKTYYSTLMDGSRVRNFSVCYDTVKMCSRWVAYPGHSVYRKWGSYQVGENNNSGRTNAWAFDDAVTQYAPSTDYNCAYEIVSKYNSKTDAYDTAKEPIIPHRRQADICYTNAFGWGWARGHMLPSSQRYNTWENNAQTCYATNIMVQQYDFNSGGWADLEALERNKNCSDTLYVVVGTLFEDSKTITRFGRTIGVPTHCYKLLLRTKSGNSRKAIGDITSADELICIGFLYENSEVSKDATMASAAMSVAEIEKRSGFKFFRNLNPAIAEKVKSQKRLSDWGL